MSVSSSNLNALGPERHSSHAYVVKHLCYTRYLVRAPYVAHTYAVGALAGRLKSNQKGDCPSP